MVQRQFYASPNFECCHDTSKTFLPLKASTDNFDLRSHWPVPLLLCMVSKMIDYSIACTARYGILILFHGRGEDSREQEHKYELLGAAKYIFKAFFTAWWQALSLENGRPRHSIVGENCACFPASTVRAMVRCIKLPLLLMGLNFCLNDSHSKRTRAVRPA